MIGIGRPPSETFPLIGTVQNPALFYDGQNLLLSYEIAPRDDDGIAILEFEGVIHFEKNPINVDGLSKAQYPAKAWEFTEVEGSQRTEYWKALGARFWTISFNDVTVEVVFTSVRKVFETRRQIMPDVAIKEYLTRL